MQILSSSNTVNIAYPYDVFDWGVVNGTREGWRGGKEAGKGSDKINIKKSYEFSFGVHMNISFIKVKLALQS